MVDVVPIPIPMQIANGQFMGMQQGGPTVGLDILSTVNTLLIEQVKTFNNAQRKCLVKDTNGTMLFTLVKSVEYVGCNAFVASVYDNSNQIIMQLNREITCCPMACLCSGCCNGCCNSCVVQTEIQAPSGIAIGYLTQRSTLFTVDVEIFDEQHNKMIDIDSSNIGCCTVIDQMAFISEMNGRECGSFTKRYDALGMPSVLIHPQFYQLDFKPEANLKERQLMLGSLLSLYVIGIGQPEVVKKRR